MFIEESQPLVSIIINNYNYGCYLKDCINSAIEQTYYNIEIIVVDDGSTDNSQQILESYKDKINPIFKNNAGQASAFNVGFDTSKGEIICFLDSDDYFEPNKIEEIVKVFKSYKEIGWCFHPLQYINTNTKKTLAVYPPPPKNNEEIIDFRKEICSFARVPKFGPATSGLCFHRSLLKQILPMPEDQDILSDYYIRYLAVSQTKGFFLSLNLGILRIHSDNAWTNQSNNPALKAKRLITTAYWLKMKSSKLDKLASKSLAWGLGNSLYSGKVFELCNDKVIWYLSHISHREKIEIFLRAVYSWMKQIIHSVTKLLA